MIEEGRVPVFHMAGSEAFLWSGRGSSTESKNDINYYTLRGQISVFSKVAKPMLTSLLRISDTLYGHPSVFGSDHIGLELCLALVSDQRRKLTDGRDISGNLVNL